MDTFGKVTRLSSSAAFVIVTVCSVLGLGFGMDGAEIGLIYSLGFIGVFVYAALNKNSIATWLLFIWAALFWVPVIGALIAYFFGLY